MILLALAVAAAAARLLYTDARALRRWGQPVPVAPPTARQARLHAQATYRACPSLRNYELLLRAEAQQDAPVQIETEAMTTEQIGRDVLIGRW